MSHWFQWDLSDVVNIEKLQRLLETHQWEHLQSMQEIQRGLKMISCSITLVLSRDLVRYMRRRFHKRNMMCCEKWAQIVNLLLVIEKHSGKKQDKMCVGGGAIKNTTLSAKGGVIAAPTPILIITCHDWA